MSRRTAFPEELYRLVPALYPHFADLINNAGLTPTEFFALSYVRNAGQSLNGTVVLPLSDLKAMLIRVGAYSSDSGANGFITGQLEIKKRYLEPLKLDPEQKQSMFPASTGYRDAVALSESGKAHLEMVNGGVERLFMDVSRGVPRTALKLLLAAFKRISSQVVQRLEELSAR